MSALRYTLRQPSRSPGLAPAAVLSLPLGIGANVALPDLRDLGILDQLFSGALATMSTPPPVQTL